MKYVRYSFFVIVCIFSLFCSTKISFATTGGGLFIENISVDTEKNVLYFFYQSEDASGCNASVVSYDMASQEEKRLLWGCDFEIDGRFAEYSKKEKDFEAKSQPLFLVDVKKISLESENLTFGYVQPSGENKVFWKQDYIINKDHTENVSVISCLQPHFWKSIYLRLYGRADLPFTVAVFSSTNENCPEQSGYWEDTYKIFNFQLPGDVFTSRTEPYFDRESVSLSSSEEGYSSVGKEFPLPDISRSLNDTGFGYYQKKDYENAGSFFAAAYQVNTAEKPYVLALYNSIAVGALRGGYYDLYTDIKKLLTETDEKDLYRKKIEADPDFEKVRETPEYWDTMCEFFDDMCRPKLESIVEEESFSVPMVEESPYQVVAAEKSYSLYFVLSGIVLVLGGFAYFLFRKREVKNKN